MRSFVLPLGLLGFVGSFCMALSGLASEPTTAHQALSKERGFKAGQTVPDIPLLDLQGNEVRLSKYLGKQYVIYIWASW